MDWEVKSDVENSRNIIENLESDDIDHKSQDGSVADSKSDTEDYNGYLMISFVLQEGGVGQVRLDLSSKKSSDYQVREIGTDSGSGYVDWASISSNS